MYKYNDIEISPVVESYLLDMRSVQEPRNRLHYMEKALESITASSGEMLQKLYAEVLSKNTYDFSLISESKGDIGKYKGYDAMYKCIEYLNTLFTKANATGSRELTLLNKLHDIVLSLRGDFVFGYKTNVQLIKIIYENMVLTLHQLVSVCIIMYMNYMKDTNKKNLAKFTAGTKDLIVVGSAEKFIKMYENGEWTAVMREFKKDPKGFFGSVVTSAAGLGLGVAAMGGPGAIGQQISGLGTVAKAVPGAVSGALSKIPGPAWVGSLSKFALTVAGLILIVRGCAYVYNKLPIKIKEFAKTEAEFIRANSEGDLSKAEVKVVGMLDKVSGATEAKIIKTNAEASKEISTVDSSNHSLSSDDSLELF